LGTCAPWSANRGRLWIAERDDQIIGCIGIVDVSLTTAQLRWFLIVPSARGTGLGKQLLSEAITFCEESGYRNIILWTISALKAAAHLYPGFRKVEEKPGRRWGVEKYELVLD
jgi:GNAT superfamily N-acetyltransferase